MKKLMKGNPYKAQLLPQLQRQQAPRMVSTVHHLDMVVIKLTSFMDIFRGRDQRW